MTLFLTGVGSRQTPTHICNEMTRIADELDDQCNLIIRTGTATGADAAFRNSKCAGIDVYSPKEYIHEECFEIASSIHPAWDRCDEWAKRLHARNVYQVLGHTLDQPSDLLVCWTPNGEDKGGTRTAIVLARRHNVPIFNLGKSESLANLRNFLYDRGFTVKSATEPKPQTVGLGRFFI